MKKLSNDYSIVRMILVILACPILFGAMLCFGLALILGHGSEKIIDKLVNWPWQKTYPRQPIKPSPNLEA